MGINVAYNFSERVILWIVALAGFIGVNAVFLYGAFVEPQLLDEAMRNPVAAAFIAEALLLVAVLAYLLHKWRVSHLHWGLVHRSLPRGEHRVRTADRAPMARKG